MLQHVASQSVTCLSLGSPPAWQRAPSNTPITSTEQCCVQPCSQTQHRGLELLVELAVGTSRGALAARQWASSTAAFDQQHTRQTVACGAAVIPS